MPPIIPPCSHFKRLPRCQISTALWLPLCRSDADKRRKYDAGGAAALDATDMEIDISSLGTAGTAMAAMFSKMGFRIKTAVSQQVRRARHRPRAYTSCVPAFAYQFRTVTLVSWEL